MESQNAKTNENAVQLTDGEVDSFGKHPFERGGMGDSGGGAPPVTPPPLNLGGSPLQMRAIGRSRMRSISDIKSSIASKMRDQIQAAIDSVRDSLPEIREMELPPQVDESDSLFADYQRRALKDMQSILPTADLQTDFAFFRESVMLDLEAQLAPTAEQTNNSDPGTTDSINNTQNTGIDSIQIEMIDQMQQMVEQQMENALEMAAGQAGKDMAQKAVDEMALSPVDQQSNMSNQSAIIDVASTSSENSTDIDSQLAPLDAAISSFMASYETLLGAKTALENLEISPDWETSLTTAIGNCTSGISPLTPFKETISNFPASLGLNTPLNNDLSAFFADLGNLTEDLQNWVGRLNAIINHESAERRTQRVAFRTHMKANYPLQMGTIDAACNHLFDSGVNPADSSTYRVIMGEGGTIEGTEGIDIIIGTPGADHIIGKGGADFIIGGAGDDILMGGSGRDTILGGDGNDLLEGGADNDTLVGQGGNDTMRGGDGDDRINAWGGNGTATGGSGDNLIEGGAGNDDILSGYGDDTIHGGAGDDSILDWGGINIVHGDAGNDDIRTGAGHDAIFGGDGNDTISSGYGDDTLSGGAGVDTFDSGTGEDIIYHEAGETHDAAAGESHLDDRSGMPDAITVVEPIDISTGTFAPSAATAGAIQAAGATGLSVPVNLGGGFAPTPIHITWNGSTYQTAAPAFVKAADYPLIEIFGTFLDYGVRVSIAENVVTAEAETRISGTDIPLTLENLDTTLHHLGINLNGLDFGLGEGSLEGLIFRNTYSNGNLNFELIDIPVQIGEFVRGTAQIGFAGGGIYVSGQLAIDLGQGASGFLDLSYDGGGVSGSATVDVNYGDVTGSMNVYYNQDGVRGLAGSGTGQISTSAFSAELDLFFGPNDWVNGQVQSHIDAMAGVQSGEGPSPEIQSIPEETTSAFNWAGIVRGTVPIGSAFEANATGILDSRGDYVLNLSIGNSTTIPLTQGHQGAWELDESYPVASFGIPLASVSATLGAYLDFSYNLGPVNLTEAHLSGTYAKSGNKYGVTNTVDLGGTLSMDDSVTLGGGLELGIQEQLLTQTGKVQLKVGVDATVSGTNTAEADLQAELDEDGFHPHFSTSIDMSQNLSVKLTGKFIAENTIKHWVRHNTHNYVERDLVNIEMNIGHMDLEMGYNSDAPENKFTFGPPEGQDKIFQAASLESLIEQIHSSGTEGKNSVTWYGSQETVQDEVENDQGYEEEEQETSDEMVDFRGEPIPAADVIGDEISSLESEVISAAPLTFELPNYVETEGEDEQSGTSAYDLQVKTYKVLQALEDVYGLDDSKLEEEELTEADAHALAGHIRLVHGVFEEFKVVDDDEMVDSSSFNTPAGEDYWAYEFRASPEEGAPAAKKASLEVFREVEDLNDQADIARQCVEQAVDMIDSDPQLASSHFSSLKSSSQHLTQWVSHYQNYLANPGTIDNFLYTSYGYAVETIACHLLNNRAGELSPLVPIFQAARGHSRPDIIYVDDQNKDRAWLDITSDASAGHIYTKQSSGWHTREYVAEILYPQLNPAALAQNSGTLTEQQQQDLAAAADAQAADAKAFQDGKAEVKTVLEEHFAPLANVNKTTFERDLGAVLRGIFQDVPSTNITRAQARSILYNFESLTVGRNTPNAQTASGSSWGDWMRKGSSSKTAGAELLQKLGYTLS